MFVKWRHDIREGDKSRLPTFTKNVETIKCMSFTNNFICLQIMKQIMIEKERYIVV